MKFALEKPAFRIVVNTSSAVGAIGYTTALTPSLTLGPGTWGGSIVSENVTAKHLMNIKTLAFETKPINFGHALSSFNEPNSVSSYNSQRSFIPEIEDRLKARAGNPVVNPVKNNFDNNTSQKKDQKYGNGISESEIQKIIREFNG